MTAEFLLVCVHCARRAATRPRGLCSGCYYGKPELRTRYPARAGYGQRGVGNGNARVAPAACPTDALPGSPAKVLVMAIRARLRQELWHPLDEGNRR
jgi:transposase